MYVCLYVCVHVLCVYVCVSVLSAVSVPISPAGFDMMNESAPMNEAESEGRP